MKLGGNLSKELRDLDEITIHSKKDAKAICQALKILPNEYSTGVGSSSSALHALASLFQNVDHPLSPAFKVLYTEGVPELIRIFDATVQKDDERDTDDLLFVLKIMATYGSRAGAEKVVEAAKRPLKPDAYMWHVVLNAFSEGHPHREYAFRALSDPLPTNFLAIALLDSANNAAVKGKLQSHPFDSAAGFKRLRDWLEDTDPEHASYAHSATTALPFVSNPARDQLLALALEHSEITVQLESAWAAGKLGREAGLKVLARYCLDMNHSNVAQRYLAELGREDLVPEESKDASFRAKAEFASWLAHPNELGKPPDELEIVDHRVLAWPPEREPKPFWLIRYRLHDQTGIEDDEEDYGLVGSATWCFFSYKMHQRPPEDAYAIHCYWEMENEKLIDEHEVTDASEYAGMLGQWHGPQLKSATIKRIAELSPKLSIPARLVALACAVQDEQEGWVVLDGPRSTWYPKSEQPKKAYEAIVLMIHVGRQLLGFGDAPDRRRYLPTDRPNRSPRQFVDAYEAMLSEVAKSAPKRQKELLGSHSLLARHFEEYVDSLVEVEGRSKPDTVVRVYERILELAAQSDGSVREKAYDSFSILGENFDLYVDALISQGRSADVIPLIEMFVPHWDHNLGYGNLGSAAFRAGYQDIAEPFLLKLREQMEGYFRSEEMSMLAEIWFDRGEAKEARELLVECLQKIVIEIKESKYNSDRKTYADTFRHHRSTYMRLFSHGAAELSKLGIPVDPL